MSNPSGKGGFQKGVSGNPGGRSRRDIVDLAREARRYAYLGMSTLVRICRHGKESNRLAAAREILDRGYGRPVQMIDAAIITKKLNEMTPEELDAFEARLLTRAASAVVIDTEVKQLELLPADTNGVGSGRKH